MSPRTGTAPRTSPAGGAPGRTGSPVLIIAAREIRAAVLKKSTLITLVLMLAAIIGGVTAVKLLGGDDEPSSGTVAVVGEAPFPAPRSADAPDAPQAPGTPGAAQHPGAIGIVPAADAAAARGLVESGDVDAALIPGDDGSWTMLVEGSPDPALSATVGELVQSAARDRAIAAAGADPAAVNRAAAAAGPRIESLETTDTAGIFVAMVGAMVVMSLILMFGGMIALSVMEEKSSRVVEIMLATVRPLQLLAGKILGAGIAGMAFAVVLVGTAVAALAATGVAADIDLPLGTLLWFLPFFVVTYLFFGSLYAAAASLVSRVEDFQGAQWPVMLLAMVTFYIPAAGVAQIDSPVLRVLAWVPPTSSTLAPMQYAAGNMGVGGMLAALALMLVAAVLVTWLASVIYPRNVLRIGATIRWRDALRR